MSPCRRTHARRRRDQLRRGALGCLLLATRAAAQRDCTRDVVVDGDADVAVAVREALARRSAASSSARCEPVRATVTRRGTQLAVRIVDGSGRSSERTVAELQTVADLIDTWANGDGAALSEGSAPAPPPRPALGVTSGAGVVAEDRQAPPAPPRPAGAAVVNPRWSLGATAEATVATDRSLWFGVSLHGCVRFGPMCPGVLARVASDSRLGGQTAVTPSTRLVADLLVVLEYSLRLGRVALVPGFGVGFGWLHIGQLQAAGADEVDVDAGGLRVDAHVALSILLHPRLWLDVTLSLDASPLAHTAVFVQETGSVAGEPWGYLRGGFGLRYGEL